MRRECCFNTTVPGVGLVLFTDGDCTIKTEAGIYPAKEIIFRLEGRDKRMITPTQFKEHGGKAPFPTAVMELMLQETFENGMATFVMEKDQITGDFIPGDFQEKDLPMETWILIPATD